MADPILVARAGTASLNLLPALANRHGLITGATGTGKSVSLQTLAEGFSRIGVPVFLADVKGDLAGLGMPGAATPKLQTRLEQLGIEGFKPQANPVAYWDVFGQAGHPVRATVSDMGPMLLGRLLELNDTQAGVLNLVFKIADDNGMLLLDFKDLRAMVSFVGDNAKQFTTDYGNISTQSIGAIQRALLALDQQGASQFFGEPMIAISDLMRVDDKGRGVINILAADRLYNSPRLYGTFLLWLLSELFEQLPEVGDADKPKLVFFFDEAHLMFDEAPPALLQKIEQVVRLIRSKGVGVYFITQSPLDVPDAVLGQLGNRIQHALRAFTPRDQKAVKAAAETLRANVAFDAAEAIMALGTGEALVSFLDAGGRPAVVERALIVPPSSRLGAINEDERRALIQASELFGRYEDTLDRESAYEKLRAQKTGAAPVQASPQPASHPASEGGGVLGGFGDLLGNSGSPRRRGDSMMEAAVKSVVRTVGAELGRQIVRGLLGSIMGGRR